MKTAAEAKAQSEIVREKLKREAEQYALGRLDEIEQAINEAASRGEFRCWVKAAKDDNFLMRFSAISETLTKLNYNIDITDKCNSYIITWGA